MKSLTGLFVLLATVGFVWAQGVVLPPGESVVVNGTFKGTGEHLDGWNMRGGGHGTFELTSPQTGSPDPVLTMKVRKGDVKPWVMELQQSVSKAVEKGAIMYITFEYKMTEGYSFQFYWQEERPPWPKLLSLRLTSPFNTWRRVRLAAPVHATYVPDSTSFSFHLAEAPGILQLRNFDAVLVPGTIDVDDLDTNETVVLGGDFYDREWRDKIKARLVRNRGRRVQVRVHKRRPGAEKSRNHPPASEAVVLIKQRSRSFRLGVSITAPLIYPEQLSRPELSFLRQWLGEVLPKPGAYAEKTLGNPLFSMVHCLGMFTWRQHEGWGRLFARTLAEDVRKAGKELWGGYLYEPSFSALPAGSEKRDRKELNQLLQDNIEKTVRGMTGKMGAWAVLHNAITQSEVYNHVGVDSLQQSFASVVKADGKVPLLVSDSQALSGLSETPLLDMIELVSWLQETGKVRVDGLLLGACMKRLDVAPQTLERRLDIIRRRLPNMPIHITQLAVNMPKEELQSEMLRDYLLLFYADPSVASVSLGELWSPAAEIPALGYFREDFSPKPSYLMVQKLFNEEWASTAELKTDQEGKADCMLLEGTYDVMVAFETTTKRFSFKVPDRKTVPITCGGGIQQLEGDGFTITTGGHKGSMLLDVYLDPQP